MKIFRGNRLKKLPNEPFPNRFRGVFQFRQFFFAHTPDLDRLRVPMAEVD